MDRMFQDAAGLTPAFEAGHPVGLVKRLAGTVDAAQATALSRPALGRWPRGAKPRNKFRLTSDLTNGTYWSKSQCTIDANGLITSTGGIGGGNGFPVVRPTSSGTIAVNTGDKVTISLTAFRDEAGVNPANHITIEVPSQVVGEGTSTRRASFSLLDGSVATNNATQIWGSAVSLGGGRWRVSATFLIGETFSRNFYGQIFGGDYAAQPVGVTVYAIEPQMEYGETATPYQATDADGVPLAGYGAVRNRAMGAQGGEEYFAIGPTTSNGMTMTRIGSGVDPVRGVYHRYRLIGTSLSGGLMNILRSLNGFVYEDRGYGKPITLSAAARLVSGTLSTNSGGRLQIVQKAGSVTKAWTMGTQIARTSEWSDLVQSIDPTDPDVNSLGINVGFGIAAGESVDIVMDFAEIQAENGLVKTPLQLNYGPNNVTEQGVEDVWFLVNDGNDALPVTLPAGTYGIAWVNPAGGISYDTQTLAAEGTIDALRGTRMCDVIIRQDDFTPAEKALIETEWSAIAA